MAEAKINVRQGNGTFVSVEGVIPDDYAVEITTMLAAMLFEASANPTPMTEPVTTPEPAPTITE